MTTLPGVRPAASLALAALFAGAVAIAFAPVFVRLAETGPVATAFWRMALSLPLLFAWTRLEAPAARLRPADRRHWGLLLLIGLCFAGDLGVWHWSIRLTSIANATFLVNLAPLFVVAGAWLLFAERPRPLFVVALVTAVAGAALLAGASFGLTGTALLGDGLALLAAAFYGAYQLAVKRARAGLSTAAIMCWSGTVTAGVLLAAALARGEALLPRSAAGWGVLLALALVCQVAGQTLITYAFAHLRAGLSSVSLLLQPVAATLLAWLIFGETLTPLQVLGSGLVLAGIWLARRGG